tara:strand:+ start:9599 stop:9859 length:261 start_codon:yes stop_codon:yes gene_type:complete
MSITNIDDFNKIFKDLVSEIMEISLEEVQENMNIEDFDNWDSFNHIKFILSLEEEFDVSFSDKEIELSTDLIFLKQNLLNKLGLAE